MRKDSPEQLLDLVVDQKSFIEFVRALAEERGEAECGERDNPVQFQLGGSLGWQNESISDYLYASLAYFDSKPFHKPETVPSWKMFAQILYFGKVYE